MLVGVAAVGAVAVAACSSSGDSGGSGDYSVVDAVEQLPGAVVGDDQTMITTGDLDRATEVAGIERPTSTEDAYDWLVKVTLGRADDVDVPVFVPLGDMASTGAKFSDLEGYESTVGFSVNDVSSFVEAGMPPATMAVFQGEFDDDLFEDLEDLGDGIFSNGTLDDFEQDLTARSGVDPLGRSIRFAERDGRVASSTATPAIEDWLDEDAHVPDDIVAVAEALDDAEVYSAVIVRQEDGFGYRPAPTSDGFSEIAESDWAPTEPFFTVGIGWSVVDDVPVVTLVFAHEDADGAEVNAELFEAAMTEGVSLLQGGLPMDEIYDLDEVTSDDDLVIVTTGVVDDRALSAPYNGLVAYDVPFFHV